MKHRILVALLALSLLLALPLTAAGGPSGGAGATAGWHVERPDAPRQFHFVTPRTLAMDSTGHAHMAYGGDHLYYAWHDGTDWHTEVVDPAWGVGAYSSLALDDSGRPHISYADGTDGSVKYATRDASGWHISRVGDGGTGAGTAIAFRNGDPCILYYDHDQSCIKWARHYYFGWVVETIDTVGSEWSYAYCALALDGNNRPHVVYHHQTQGVKYGYWDGTAWHLAVIDPSVLAGAGMSLVTDAANRPRLAYFRYLAGSFHLRYAAYDGSAWQNQEVDAADDSGGSSLALDGSGRPCVSYVLYRSLTYAVLNGNSWQKQTVAAVGDGWFGSSLALSPAGGRPWISYLDNTTHELKVAHDDGVAWRTAVVDRTGGVGFGTSVALDGAQRPAIAYRDQTNLDLKYAYRDAGGWHNEVVDDGCDPASASLAFLPSGVPAVCYRAAAPGAVVRYAARQCDGSSCTWSYQTVESGGEYDSISLAVDATGRAQVAYHDTARYRFSYAYRDGSGWHSEVIDTGGRNGRIALALDAAGEPRVAYWDEGNAQLKYARRTTQGSGSVWTKETADGQYHAGDAVSLAIDTAGRPHISYGFYSTPGALKYATKDATGWHTAVVDGAHYSPSTTSLALDPAGVPHITYESPATLLHAWRPCPSCAWQIETVDSQGQVGRLSDLAIDSAGRLHASYYDTTYQQLRYATQYVTYGLHLPIALRGH